MSKGSASNPAAAPDPSVTAAAQAQSNITTAQNQAAINNANTYSPYGSSTWTPTTNAQGQTTYSLNQQLSPQMQQLFGSQTNLAQTLAGNVAPQLAGNAQNILASGQNLLGAGANLAGSIPTQLNLSNVAPITQLSPSSFQTNVAQGPIQSAVNANFPSLINQAQNAAYQSQTQYLNPQWQQSQSNLQQQLADQGIQEGTPAYSRAMLDFNNQKQQAYGNAQDQAVQAGNQQEQALFGQSLGAGQFANQAQQQQFGQGMQLADLYNQAVLGAAGQQNTAVGLGMQQAEAQAQQPIAALQALIGAGATTTQAGLGSLAQAAGMINQAPTWPISIPTMGGTPTTIAPTSMAQIQQAATGQNQLGYNAAMQNLQGLGSIAGSVTGANGLFGSGSMLSNLFSGAAPMAGTDTADIGLGAAAATSPYIEAAGAADFAGGAAGAGVTAADLLPFLAA
jgi:hypothetical protein